MAGEGMREPGFGPNRPIVIVVDDAPWPPRPTPRAVMDVRSRAIVGFHLSFPPMGVEGPIDAGPGPGDVPTS